jgi:hypothetical protein
MTVQLLANTLVGIALVVFLAVRQASWRSVDPTRIRRGPLVLGAVGVVLLAQSAAVVTTVDVVFLAVEAIVAVGLGLAMGALTRFRTAAEPDRRGRTLQSRTGWVGAGLWVALIAVRIVLDLVGGHLAAHLLTSTGAVLLTIAVNRAACALVVDQRIPRPARGMMVP